MGRARGEEYTTAGGEFLLRTSDEPPNGTLDSLIRDVAEAIRAPPSRRYAS